MTRALSCILLGLWACGPASARNVADSLPQLDMVPVPFRYPLGLYEQRIEGDVTIQLHLDSTGAVVPDSSRIVESSGYAQLDSAAKEGAATLRFRPARLGGRAVPLTVLFPVKFRVPEAMRARADSIARDTRRGPGKP